MAKVLTLRRQRDFDELFGQGQKYRDELVMTVVRLRPDTGPARASFLVGKKVDRRAVGRNRIRRRLREAWRLELANIKAGVDTAFVAHPAAAAATYQELAAVMRRHLHQAGVLEE